MSMHSARWPDGIGCSAHLAGHPAVTPAGDVALAASRDSAFAVQERHTYRKTHAFLHLPIDLFCRPQSPRGARPSPRRGRGGVHDADRRRDVSAVADAEEARILRRGFVYSSQPSCGHKRGEGDGRPTSARQCLVCDGDGANAADGDSLGALLGSEARGARGTRSRVTSARRARPGSASAPLLTAGDHMARSVPSEILALENGEDLMAIDYDLDRAERRMRSAAYDAVPLVDDVHLRDIVYPDCDVDSEDAPSDGEASLCSDDATSTSARRITARYMRHAAVRDPGSSDFERSVAVMQSHATPRALVQRSQAEEQNEARLPAGVELRGERVPPPRGARPASARPARPARPASARPARPTSARPGSAMAQRRPASATTRARPRSAASSSTASTASRPRSARPASATSLPSDASTRPDWDIRTQVTHQTRVPSMDQEWQETYGRLPRKERERKLRAERRAKARPKGKARPDPHDTIFSRLRSAALARVLQRNPGYDARGGNKELHEFDRKAQLLSERMAAKRRAQPNDV